MASAVSICYSFPVRESVYIIPNDSLKSVAHLQKEVERMIKNRVVSSKSYHIALCSAVIYGKIPVVQAIIDIAGKVLLKYGDSCGRTPLIWALVKDRYLIIKWMILHGDDVNRTDANGKTPLCFALEMKKIPFVKILLKYGAVANLELNREQVQIVAKAQKDIDQEIDDETAELQKNLTEMPKELVRIVAKYYVD